MGKYANAAKDMLRWLMARDIRGGPVSQPTKRNPVITVYGMTSDGVTLLPTIFDGFIVEGTTDTPNYDRNQLRDMIRRPKGRARQADTD